MCDHYNENNGEKEVEDGNDKRMQVSRENQTPLILMIDIGKPNKMRRGKTKKLMCSL